MFESIEGGVNNGKIAAAPPEPLTFPLSFAEQRLWFLDQLEPGKSVYNVPEAMRFTGPLQVQSLERAINEIIRRHESLRTTFSLVDGRAMQIVAPSLYVGLAVSDLQHLPESERERVAASNAADLAGLPFDLQRGPLLRATLFVLRPDEHVLLLVMHHIVSEGGWSMSIFLREMGILYNAYSLSQPSPLPDLPIQYGDYSVWQRDTLQGAVLEPHLSYWKYQLEGAPALIDWSADRQRPAAKTYRGARQSIFLPKELKDSLNVLCRKEGVTLFMTLLATFQTLLHRLTRQEDLIVGVPVAGRTPQTQGLIGLFLNTIALRLQPSGEVSFRQFLKQVRQVVFDGLAHQDLPFEVLVEAMRPDRNLAFTPLFQVMFAFQNAPRTDIELIGIEVTPCEVEIRSSMFDLTFFAWEKPDGLRIVFEYSTDLFEPTTIGRMLTQLQVLLEGIVRNPEEVLSKLPLLTGAERRCVLEKWNDTKTEYPSDKCVQELFEEQVERTPDAIAVIYGEQRLTYRELNERANQLANELRKHGAGPDQLVGLCVERSADMIMTLLAIVKAGAAYLPLDPLLPSKRLSYMLEDSGVRVVVTEQSLSRKLPAFVGTTILLENAGWQANRRGNLAVAVGPEHLAYVTYTSGSTGKPKGVQVPRGALTNLLWTMREWLQLNECDRLLAVTTISFDIASVDVWLPLLAGAQMVVARREAAADGSALRGLLERHDITFLQATPVTWRLLFDAGWRGKPDLQAVCTGEAMPPDVTAQLVSVVKRVWNLYGPTETTIWSTGYRVTDGQQSILIGRPVANTQCYILDAHGQPVPIGVSGELYIGGDGLARGYVNLPELTAEKFVPDPFGREPGGRLYKTGDLARYLPDGNLEFLGRADQQVKIRGYRIELGEIEAALNEQPEIKQAVVIAREDTPGDKRLVAYLVASTSTVPATSELRTRLEQWLPDYMIPAAYVFMDQLPVTANGKIDRKALPAPEVTADRIGEEQYAAPRTPVEQQLASIWADVLHRQSVGIRENFFDIGGHSLLAVQLIAKVLSAFPGSQPSLALLLKAPTVEQFASILKVGQSDSSCLVPMREGAERPPFFCLSGAGDNSINLRDLAMAMPSDQPFYCLQDRAFDGHSAPFSSVEETADCYIGAIRRVQSHGPYYLGGRCYGGLVAFEMGRRLRSMGETVSVLALIESFNPTYASSLSKPKLLYFNLRFFLHLALDHIRILARIRPREWGRYLSACARDFLRRSREVARQAGWGNGNQFPIDRPPGGPQRLEGLSELEKLLNRILNANILAARAFVPKAYDGHLLLFRGTTRYEHIYKDGVLGWRSLALGGVTAYEIEGRHSSIFHNPNVAALAMRLDSALREAQRADR